MKMSVGFIWLRTGTSGGLLSVRHGASWQAERLSASQGFSSLDSLLVAGDDAFCVNIACGSACSRQVTPNVWIVAVQAARHLRLGSAPTDDLQQQFL
jgi:hypothetical protein